MNAEGFSILLAAKTELEVDDAFDLVYNELTNKQGDYSEYNVLMYWAMQEDVLPKLHTEVILAIIRLPYLVRGQLDAWRPMLDAIHEEFLKREESPDCVKRLLWGLLG